MPKRTARNWVATAAVLAIVLGIILAWPYFEAIAFLAFIIWIFGG